MIRRRVGYTGTIFGSDLWAAAWRREEGRKVSINQGAREVGNVVRKEGVLMGGREERRSRGGEREREKDEHTGNFSACL
jgi:hypothetical protein